MFEIFSDANSVIMKHLLSTIFALLIAFNLSAQNTHNGHEYIDLGLSVKWATHNVGANTPEECGDYYAWGETTTKSTYFASNCTTWKKDIGDISDAPQYDTAAANWKGSWRMPTLAEFNELQEKCTWAWTTCGGANGYEVTSKINGNSIFLPAAGYYAEESLEHNGVRGMYWVTTPAAKGTQYAYNYYFDKGYKCAYWISRADGHSVRPVIDIDSDNATNCSEESDNKASNDHRTKRGSATEKPANEESTNEGSENKESADNIPSKAVTQNTHNGHTYIDLGLSVKWATYNVGANVPEEYGDYYAWGETETKRGYTWENCNTAGEEIGYIGGTSLDVARVKWGGNWRMPTKAEFEELQNGCKWEWNTLNGVNGYKVIGPNGNSIFLPAAGSRFKNELDGDSSFGYYWGSTPSSEDTHYAYILYFLYEYQSTNRYYRYFGLTVRPVLE